MIADPENNFTITPQRTFVYADKLYQLGILKHKAESWKDYFFSEAHTLPGS
jgi:NitT/TauT family transport system substrate-binding protein